MIENCYYYTIHLHYYWLNTGKILIFSCVLPTNIQINIKFCWRKTFILNTSLSSGIVPICSEYYIHIKPFDDLSIQFDDNNT